MFKRACLLPAALIVSLAGPAAAQDTPGPDTVMATVGGTEITLGHMIALRTGLPQDYAQLPAELLFSAVLDQLVQQTLLMQSHDGSLSRRSALQLENDRRAVIANEVIGALFANAVQETDLQVAYDTRFADTDTMEYRAAHILVETEETAQALVAQLNDGANFAALAREHSVGPSGPNGGDLGWFSDGVMVPAFFDVVAALEPEQISAPLKTQFGWHVIRLNETRQAEAPEFDEVRDELAAEAQQAAFEARIATLEARTEVTRTDITDMDPDLINAVDLLEN